MREFDSERPELSKNNRRRSLFHIPLSPWKPNSQRYSVSEPVVGSLPPDIIREIVDLLTPLDILSFSLTSTRTRQFLIPALYNRVSLRSSRVCLTALTMFEKNPDICSHVRLLTVRPNYYLAWPKPDDVVDENLVSSIVERMSCNLKSLHTFDWDGLEMPTDSLWKKLRECCPNLRNIFCNVGLAPLNSRSQLFQFSNLKSFSLIIRYGLNGSDLFPSPESLPTNLWDMLVHRSPDLEELSICSFSSSARIFDFSPVVNARWHNLHTLTLGSFGYQADFSLGPADNTTFFKFLDDHPTLKYIRLQWNFRRWMSPFDVRLDLSPNALPNLETFVGIYQQLEKLPNASSIETLDLTCEPLHENRLDVMCHSLRNLTSLTSLDLWVHLSHPNQDNTPLFLSILSACPNLTDFHLMCTMAFSSKILGQLLSQLHRLPELKRFSLTKGHTYGDKSMLKSALKIIRAKPSIRLINIRWARENAPNHLKQEGTYDITVDEDGKPKYMMVYEQGIPLIGPSFNRQYKYTFTSSFSDLLWSTKLARILRN